MDEPELMTVDEVAAYLRISVAALYGMNHAGTAPPRIKVGRSVRYRRRDLEKWLTAQTIDG